MSVRICLILMANDDVLLRGSQRASALMLLQSSGGRNTTMSPHAPAAAK
jgi:hypothetical protein